METNVVRSRVISDLNERAASLNEDQCGQKSQLCFHI